MSSEFKFRTLTSEDWKEGIGGIRTYDKHLSLNGNENTCTYISELLDSGIPGCSWCRIVLDADIPEDSTIAVSFEASETENVKISPDSKKIVFKKVKDVLIQASPGRYIQLQIELQRDRKEIHGPVLKQVKVYYHRLSYTSAPLDSGIPGCSWHRIVLDADIPENSTITVSFRTSETEENEAFSNNDKSITFTKAKDALIQVPLGRYVRLKIDFHREGKEAPILRQLKVYYERLSYLRYLPAIYQDDSENKEFLERFLSIFESSMYDSEEIISSLPLFFDPMAAPKEFYHWLADWLSLDLYDLLEEYQKRGFILNAVKLYKKKGTISGLADLVSLLTGKKCCIKEYKNNVFCSWGMKHNGENELDNDEKADIFDCGTKTYKKYSECTKFYRKTSRTVDTSSAKISDLLTNRGKYCDELHYITGTSSGKNGQQINYFSNSIGIFVLFPFGEGLQIERSQLRKIIDSFLPVFVRADITYVETTSLEESYSLNLISDKYSDEVIAPEPEDYSLDLIGDEHSDEAMVPPLEEGNEIQYVKGECTDGVEYWTRFYTYYRSDSPDHPYGRTYSEKNPEYKNFRTANRKIISTFSI